MKVFKNNKYIKLVPKEFTPVVDDFNFTSEKKRLTSEERSGLGVSLTKHLMSEYFSAMKDGSDIQERYCYGVYRERDFSDVVIVEVKRSTGRIEYRVKYKDSMEILIPGAVVNFYPNDLMEKKNEW